MNILNIKKNYYIVGRASSGIYLILNRYIKSKEVIIPANVCYAAVYPIIYSGNKPVFIDINPKTGNMNFEDIIKKVNENTGCIIFPHMYGNPSPEIIKLKKYCNSKNILLIEDAASAMGARICDQLVGSFGDFSVFSTGHAKIIDVGNGGIVISDNDLSFLKNMDSKLKRYDSKIQEKNDLFSLEYRKLRNLNDDYELKKFFSRDYKQNFLYRINQATKFNIKMKVSKLPSILKERADNYKIFSDSLEQNNYWETIKYSEFSTPWRFTILIKNPDHRRQLINYFLSKNLFISDWYPNIAKFFVEGKYPNADRMEKEVINFSLTLSKDEIRKICIEFNNFWRSICQKN